MLSPQAFQEYQQAKKDNNPEELLNKVVGGFNPQQKQQWDSMMGGLQPQNNNNINTKK
jgi:tRNA uridine 5-carbamoylmethylation protein Kti12